MFDGVSTDRWLVATEDFEKEGSIVVFYFACFVELVLNSSLS